MRLVMVVKSHFGVVAETARAAKFVDLENVVDVRGVIAQKFLRHVAARVLLDVFAIFLADPAHAADVAIKNGGKFATADTNDIDVLTGFSGNRQNLVDGEIGMVASVAFKAGQPLLLNGREQVVVLK